jgi:hypothetical protein
VTYKYTPTAAQANPPTAIPTIAPVDSPDEDADDPDTSADPGAVVGEVFGADAVTPGGRSVGVGLGTAGTGGEVGNF